MARVQTYASLNGGALSLSTVRTLIRDQTRKEPEIEDIQAITAGYFKLSVSDLSSNRRPRAISYPRQMAMYLCRRHTSHSLKKIGMAFSKKDHSTVVYAVRRIEKELGQDSKVKQDLENIENLLR
jgi:chromosomal replication initiator protein